MGTDTGLSYFWQLLTSANAEQIKIVVGDQVWLALLVCFGAGILTSLTPCVYPMIPITINIFGRLSRKSAKKQRFNLHTFALSGIYVAGMSATYSIMGLVAGLTGALFGNILQNPWMLGFLTLLFLALAIAQLGVIKLSLPASWQTKLAQGGHTDSVSGIFVMGLLSGLIVSPCVGPVIAGVLAFVFNTSNATRGFFCFLSFSLGLGMLFLLIGGFSGVLSQLPRSGAWMTRVNRFLALLMLLASGYYGVLLVKQLKGPQEKVATASSLQWLSSVDQALAQAKTSGTPVIVDFTAEWCEACHVIDQTIFSRSDVQQVMKTFTLLRVDVTESNDTNEKIRQHFGVMSLPTILFVKPDGTILTEPRVHGVIPPEEFLTILSTVR